MTPEQERKLAEMQIEYPRRRQIFDDSIALIQRTNNPDVLYRRYDEICNFIKWTWDKKKNGYPLRIDDSEEEMNERTSIFFNYHAARIAHYIFDKAPKSKKNGLLNEIILSLKDGSNKREKFDEITQLIKSLPI